MIGPKHYEGWSCNGCEHLMSGDYSFCKAKFEGNRSCVLNHRIDDVDHTPSWCPYLRGAIMKHVVGDES